MISVADGQNRVLQAIATVTPIEIVPLRAALGRVLAERVRAPFDVPPADNSAVDGYAVSDDDIPGEHPRDLAVIADLPAGAVFGGALARGQAIRIMTGAPLPAGAGTVYPQEIVERAGDRVWIGALPPGVNVRRRGEDVTSGAVVIEAGTVLRPQEVGLAASLGLCQIAVQRGHGWPCSPRATRWLSPTARTPGQIYDANRFAPAGRSAMRRRGHRPGHRPRRRAVARACSRPPTWRTSSSLGRCSVGAYDLVGGARRDRWHRLLAGRHAAGLPSPWGASARPLF
jgi:molybdopterin molybdotransferase